MKEAEFLTTKRNEVLGKAKASSPGEEASPSTKAAPKRKPGKGKGGKGSQAAATEEVEPK